MHVKTGKGWESYLFFYTVSVIVKLNSFWTLYHVCTCIVQTEDFFCWKLNTQLKGCWRFSILTILCCGKICFFLFHWGFHTPSQTDEHGLYKNKLLQLVFIWSSFDDYNSWNDINNLHVGFLGIVSVNNVNINILCIVKY